MSKSVLKFLGRNAGFSGKNNSAYFEDGKTLWLIDCGMLVFFQLVEKFDLFYYDTINVLITHLHEDHVGSLAQLLLYLGYDSRKKVKVNVISSCENMKNRMDLAGVDPNFYVLNPDVNVEWIKTRHVDFLDAYGFYMNLNGKNILYTGDTATLEPFLKYLKNTDEFYVDVSTNGSVHLKIDDVLEELLEIQKSGVDVYLMHLNDEEAISNIVKGRLNFAPIE